MNTSRNPNNSGHLLDHLELPQARYDDTHSDDDEAIIGGYLGTPERAVYPNVTVDDRPASEKIESLLERMFAQRNLLFGTIRFCEEPQAVQGVNAHLEELMENNFSVYSATNLCALLEEAGALTRITETGVSADAAEPEPQAVEVDGVLYLEVSSQEPSFWVSTEDGLRAVKSHAPLELLKELFAEDAVYLPIYKRILNMCNCEDGLTTDFIGQEIDDDPLIQQPRYYALRFIGKLEECDALVWKKAWITTEVGREGLAVLEGRNIKSIDIEERGIDG